MGIRAAESCASCKPLPKGSGNAPWHIRLLENAKVLYRCPRFDLKSRKSLRGEEKFYLADPGIYFVRNVDMRLNHGPSLENALHIYLRSRGYRLSIGRIGKSNATSSPADTTPMPTPRSR